MAKNKFDFNALPSPDVILSVDFETLFQERKKRFIEIAPQYKSVLELESEPLVVALQLESYRELMLRNRLNQALKSNLLAKATGGDLDHLGVFYGTLRSKNEEDETYRMRIRDRTIASSTAGSKSHYRSRAIEVAPTQIKDVEVDNPLHLNDQIRNNGVVRISVLVRYVLQVKEQKEQAFTEECSHHYIKQVSVDITPVILNSVLIDPDKESDEEIDVALIVDKVRTAVSSDSVKVLTDTLKVAAAELVPINVDAEIHLKEDTPDLVFDNLIQQLISQWEQDLSLGLDLTPSWLNAQLHREGVGNVELKSPTQLQHIALNQCAVPKTITLSLVR